MANRPCSMWPNTVALVQFDVVSLAWEPQLGVLTRMASSRGSDLTFYQEETELKLSTGAVVDR